MAKCLKPCRICLYETTAHGLKNIINESSTLKRVMWLCFTIVAFSVFVYHTFELALLLSSKPVSIIILPNSIKFPQPDIYICFDRIISNSYLRNPPNKDYQSMKNISNYINNLAMASKNDSPRSLNLILSNVNHKDFFKTFGLRYSETVISATCNEQSINSSFINYKNHLACLRVTPQDCELSSVWSEISMKLYVHNFPVNENDELNNITVKYNNFSFIDTTYGFQQADVTDDIKIYFENTGSTMNSLLTEVTASPNTHTKIKLSSEINEKLNRDKHKCNETLWLLSFHNYMNVSQPILLNYQSTIFTQETQMFFKKNYNCVLAEMLVPTIIDLSTTPFCLNTRHALSNNIDSKLVKNLNLLFSTLFIPKEPLCKDITYTTKVASSRWPTNTITRKLILESPNDEPGIKESQQLIKNDSKNIELIKENLYKVSIQLANTNATLIREELRYNWVNFLSDFGGIMGFYLGASVLTFCEITKIICGCCQQHLNEPHERADIQGNSDDRRIELEEKL